MEQLASSDIFCRNEMERNEHIKNKMKSGGNKG